MTTKSTTHNEEDKMSNVLKAVLLTAFLLLITACGQNQETTTPETADISATVSARVQETKQAEGRIEETVQAKIEQTREAEPSPTPKPTPTPAPGENERLDRVLSEFYNCIQFEEHFRHSFSYNQPVKKLQKSWKHSPTTSPHSSQ